MTRVLTLLISAQAAVRLVIKSRLKTLPACWPYVAMVIAARQIVETLAEYAGVPVWNGLTNEFHPTQLLADLLTMQEHLPGKAFNEMTLVYAGDARNNMGNSMLEAAALTGLDLRLVAPQACWPEAALVTECRALAQQNGGNITLRRQRCIERRR